MALAVRKTPGRCVVDGGDRSWARALAGASNRDRDAGAARGGGEGGASPGDARASASFGQGWVGDEALAVGLHAAATAGCFAEAIEVASNHDGDSDSTASIAGQLYGAKHGLAALPAEAVYRVDVLEPLLELAGQ